MEYASAIENHEARRAAEMPWLISGGGPAA